MRQSKRSARFSERLLRRALGDEEAYQGLLGDLHEEAARGARAEMGGRSSGFLARLRHDRAVLSLTWGYVLDRRRGSEHPSPQRRAGGTGRRRPLASAAEDFLLAGRLLRRRPTFAAAVIVTLGLGFGAGAAVLSVAYSVWLRPLPFAEPGDLVRVYEVKLDGDDASLAGDAPIRPSSLDSEISRRSRLSPPLLEDLRTTEWTSLVGVAAVSGISYDWEHEGDAERLSAIAASRGVFGILGLNAIEGRFFSPAPGSREVVVSEGFWRRSFGGDPEVVGARSLTLDGESYLIVGVVADQLPYPEHVAELWTPRDPSDDDLVEGMRGARYLDVVARLRPGATIAAARAELDAFVRSLGAEHPNHVGWGATVVPLRQDLVRPFVGLLQLLLAGAVLFFLIACSNVAGLVAARRVQDRAERGLRLALGASRLRVLRQEIAEMILLGAAGAAFAALLATGALAPLRRLAPADIPRLADIRLDATVMISLGVGALLAAVLAAILGHVMAGRERELTHVGYHTTTPGSAGRSTLMVVQVGLTTLLLIAGVVLASHFRDLARIERGFDADDVAAAPVLLRELGYPSDFSRLQFFEAVLEGLEQRGHVAAVGVNPPVAGATMRFGYRATDAGADLTVDQHWGQYHVVSERYFELLGIPLLSGRGFNDFDRDGSTPVVIISEALAREHFSSDPVGHEMIVVGAAREIIGVVGSVRHFGPDSEPPAEMYVTLAQDPWLLGHVLVRVGDDYSPDALREVVAAIDPRVPVPALFPYGDFVRKWFAPLRFQLTIIALLAAAGTTLAIVGLYALIAYVVAGRTRELGIRVALGETSFSVFIRVVGRGAALAASGVLLGSILALSLRGFLRSLGIGVEANDPTVLPAVAGIVVAAALVACAWPASRAARVDPVEALRRE